MMGKDNFGKLAKSPVHRDPETQSELKKERRREMKGGKESRASGSKNRTETMNRLFIKFPSHHC